MKESTLTIIPFVIIVLGTVLIIINPFGFKPVGSSIPVNIYYSNLSTDEVESYTATTPWEKNIDIKISSYINDNYYSTPRWSDKIITFNISDGCRLSKAKVIREEFAILKNKTNISIDFQETNSNADIYFICKDSINYDIDKGYIVSGLTTLTEVGTRITSARIELLNGFSNSDGKTILHEVIHALGLQHSENDESVMYPIGYDKQRLDNDTISQLNNLYPIK